MAADDLGDGPAHAQRHDVPHGVGREVGLHVDGIGQALDRFPEEELLRDLVQILRHLLEALVAFALVGPRGEAVHGAGHGIDVLDQVDLGLVLEEAAPLRVEPDQRQVLRLVAPGLGEDTPQDARHGQDGRPHVEPELAAIGASRAAGRRQPQHRGLAAEPWVLVEQRHLVPARRGGRRRRQATEAATHHHNMRNHAVLSPGHVAGPEFSLSRRGAGSARRLVSRRDLREAGALRHRAEP